MPKPKYFTSILHKMQMSIFVFQWFRLWKWFSFWSFFIFPHFMMTSLWLLHVWEMNVFEIVEQTIFSVWLKNELTNRKWAKTIHVKQRKKKIFLKLNIFFRFHISICLTKKPKHHKHKSFWARIASKSTWYTKTKTKLFYRTQKCNWYWYWCKSYDICDINVIHYTKTNWNSHKISHSVDNWQYFLCMSTIFIIILTQN